MVLDTQHGVSVFFDDVSVNYGRSDVLTNTSLKIDPGEFVSIIGPSGCGKTTMGRIVAGFINISNGNVLIDDKPVQGPNPDVGMVFQSSEALFDWLTVRKNIEYGPRMQGVSKRRRSEIANYYLHLVKLRDSADKSPQELSGGMRQRVQIARSLATTPRLIVMDEPFAALDAQTREAMQIELDRIWRETGCTVIFVTHDLAEAAILADRVVTMSAGPNAGVKSEYIVDLDRPRDIYCNDMINLVQKMRSDIAEEVAIV